MKNKKLLLCLGCSLVLGMPLLASIQLPAIFADSMALQQAANVPVWGRIEPNKKVQLTTSWSKTKYSAISDNCGSFRIEVTTPAYKDCAYGDITIVAGKEKKQIHNILFAEVWLASGQSNMEMPIRGWRAQPCYGAHEAIAHAAEGLPMRFYTTPHATHHQAQWQGQGSWCTISPATVGDVSACAYYYAREISQVMQTPVAIVQCIWSGTRIEPWMTPEAFTLLGDTVTVLSPKPDRQLPCAIYNAMVNPIVGFGIKGVIWYQGESNRDDAAKYLQLFPVMVSEWRKIWGQGDFPFYYAQIAPYTYYPTIEGALIREAQEKASRIIPNSGMAVLIDKGDKYCIHPPYKKEAGLRLAYHALNKTYGMTSLPCESPTLDSIRIKQDTVFVTFNNAPDWFVNIGDQKPDMQIAGADSVWYDAKVQLTRFEMKVTSPQVPQPIAVRYCFKNYTIGTLFTPNGLPVAPFRTDNWNK